MAGATRPPSCLPTCCPPPRDLFVSQYDAAEGYERLGTELGAWEAQMSVGTPTKASGDGAGGGGQRRSAARSGVHVRAASLHVVTGR